jgi:hypothetical protein
LEIGYADGPSGLIGLGGRLALPNAYLLLAPTLSLAPEGAALGVRAELGLALEVGGLGLGPLLSFDATADEATPSVGLAVDLGRGLALVPTITFHAADTPVADAAVADAPVADFSLTLEATL